ncbi:MAG: hypothetical protein ACK4MZ_10035 [Thermomonas haemolytica]
MRPITEVRAGPVVLATILRMGNGHPATPVRYHVAWTEIAARLGAPAIAPTRYRPEAEAMVMLWATPRMAHAPAVHLLRR